MSREKGRGELVENEVWREFRDWVKEMVELENTTVISHLEHWRFQGARGRRDAIEDVWVMIRAFEEKP